MKTLKEHNDERMAARKSQDEARKPHPNGIACPECGKELWDSDPMMMFSSCPPKKNINCPSCGYSGYRLA